MPIMQSIDHAHNQVRMFQGDAGLIEDPSAARKRDSVQIVWQPESESLTALVRQLRRSNGWESAVWVALGLASLVLLVLSFRL